MFRVWYKTIDKVFRNQKYASAKMVLADQVNNYLHIIDLSGTPILRKLNSPTCAPQTTLLFIPVKLANMFLI
jgi:hypothetical protein